MRIVTVLTALLALGACSRASSPEQFRGHTMGTTYSVTAASHPPAVRREAIQSAIDGVLNEINGTLSTYDARSEISRFNANATTDPIAVSPSLRAVAAIAGEVSVATGGAFDITVGPLVQAWGFGVESPAADIAPGPAAINRLRAEVGFGRLGTLGGRALASQGCPGHCNLTSTASPRATRSTSSRNGSMRWACAITSSNSVAKFAPAAAARQGDPGESPSKRH